MPLHDHDCRGGWSRPRLTHPPNGRRVTSYVGSPRENELQVQPKRAAPSKSHSVAVLTTMIKRAACLQAPLTLIHEPTAHTPKKIEPKTVSTTHEQPQGRETRRDTRLGKRSDPWDRLTDHQLGDKSVVYIRKSKVYTTVFCPWPNLELSGW